MERNKREIGLLPYVSLGQGDEVGQGSRRRKEIEFGMDYSNKRKKVMIKTVWQNLLVLLARSKAVNV